MAAVEIEKFHQINDRRSPVKLLLLFRGKLGEDARDTDFRSRAGRRRGRVADEGFAPGAGAAGAAPAALAFPKMDDMIFPNMLMVCSSLR